MTKKNNNFIIDAKEFENIEALKVNHNFLQHLKATDIQRYSNHNDNSDYDEIVTNIYLKQRDLELIENRNSVTSNINMLKYNEKKEHQPYSSDFYTKENISLINSKVLYNQKSNQFTVYSLETILQQDFSKIDALLNIFDYFDYFKADKCYRFSKDNNLTYEYETKKILESIKEDKDILQFYADAAYSRD